MEYARSVASAVLEVNPKANLRIVELPDLPEGGDFVDWYAKYEKENENMDEEELANLVIETLVGLCKQTKPITHDDVTGPLK